MGFSNNALQAAASAIINACSYAQLHSGTPGSDGSNNVSSAGREPVSWSSPTGSGNFTLSSPVDFTGGESSGPVTHVTFWSAASGGTLGGTFALDGDTTFNALGEYTVQQGTVQGSSSDLNA